MKKYRKSIKKYKNYVTANKKYKIIDSGRFEQTLTVPKSPKMEPARCPAGCQAGWLLWLPGWLP